MINATSAVNIHTNPLPGNKPTPEKNTADAQPDTPGTTTNNAGTDNAANTVGNTGDNTEARAAASESRTNDLQEAAKEQKVRQEVQELQIRQQEVIAHDMAHTSVGGQYVGAVRYEHARGPDGRMYISGGEVSIDTSKEKTPEETVKKMRTVKAAALAPMDPSAQDMAVAAKAGAMEVKAAQELRALEAEEAYGKTNGQAVEEESNASASSGLSGLAGNQPDDSTKLAGPGVSVSVYV